DEAFVIGRGLVAVVRLAVAKGDVKRDVEVAIVDGSRKLGLEPTRREEDDARMVLEVLSARLDQRLAGLFRRIRKREIDVVKEHRVLSCCVVSVLRGGALERLRRGTEPKPDYDREAPR